MNQSYWPIFKPLCLQYKLAIALLDMCASECHTQKTKT